MARPEHESEDAPRCPACGKWMSCADPGEEMKVYECCGLTRIVERPQFGETPEQIHGYD